MLKRSRTRVGRTKSAKNALPYLAMTRNSVCWLEIGRILYDFGFVTASWWSIFRLVDVTFRRARASLTVYWSTFMIEMVHIGRERRELAVRLLVRAVPGTARPTFSHSYTADGVCM